MPGGALVSLSGSAKKAIEVCVWLTSCLERLCEGSKGVCNRSSRSLTNQYSQQERLSLMKNIESTGRLQ